MDSTFLRSWWHSRTRAEQTAIVIGSVILLFVSVRVFCCPTDKTVYPIFSTAARLWWSGGELYEQDHHGVGQGGYRYSPVVAVFYTPFALFPDAVGGVVWRLVSAGVFVLSLAWLARSVLPVPVSRDLFAWLVLLCLPLSLQSVNNGQANLVVIAAMLAAVAAVKEERWNLASLLVALAFAFKIYPLALGMLLILLYPRRLSVRIPLAVAVSLLLPYLCQHPGYVTDQYEKWIAILRAEDRTNMDPGNMYRDLWLLIHLYEVPLSRSIYTLVQLLGGAAVAVLCWHRQRAGWPEKALLTSTLALAVAWMMLLGPATESSSFVLLAPPFAWSLLEAFGLGPGNWRRALLTASALCFTSAVVLGGFTSTVISHSVGLHSWASLLYFAYLLIEPRPMADAAMASADAATCMSVKLSTRGYPVRVLED